MNKSWLAVFYLFWKKNNPYQINYVFLQRKYIKILSYAFVKFRPHQVMINTLSFAEITLWLSSLVK